MSATTPAIPARFDHIVVAAKDLEKAITTYRTGLGFTVVPGGEHPAGTHNALVHFGIYYIELLAVRDPANPEAAWLKEWLATAGENPPTFAVAVDDLDHAVAQLDAAGVPHGEISTGQRTTPDGAILRWRSVVVAPESTPRTQQPAVIAASGRPPPLPHRGQPAPKPVWPPMPFLIEWEGGDEARRAEIEKIGALAAHPAGWRELLSVSVLVADPEFAAKCYQQAFGWPRIPDGLAGRGVVLDLAGIRLELIAPPSGGRVLPPGPRPTAIALQAENRLETLEYLRERGTADGAGRGVTPARAHGLRIALP
ncbi:MAG TPA: VOC family protein [Chloroflexota bacterium]|nr:VOC family protein [Chloroflexota bacterium]